MIHDATKTEVLVENRRQVNHADNQRSNDKLFHTENQPEATEEQVAEQNNLREL